MAGLLLLGACSSADLEIRRNQRPVAGSCALSPNATGEAITAGTFDVALGDRASYLLTPIVENNTGDRLTISAVRLRVLRETPEGNALVRIRCAGDVACEEWTVELCEDGPCPTIASGDTESFEVPALPRDVTGYFRAEMDGAVQEGRAPQEYPLIAEVVLLGESSTATYESEVFSYPIRLCLGCLVEFPPGSDSPALGGQDCCGPPSLGPACYPGQDAPIDCADCIRSAPEVCNFGRLSCAG